MCTTLSNEQATSYLTELLNRALRIHIQDGRMFIGTMKCTDRERNIVLSSTHEYRPAPPARVAQTLDPNTTNFLKPQATESTAISSLPSESEAGYTPSIVAALARPHDDDEATQAVEAGPRTVVTTDRPGPAPGGAGKVEMLKRFVGLVVVPGHVITKVEVD